MTNPLVFVATGLKSVQIVGLAGMSFPTEKRKVDAIKLYRKQTSASLMEAKQVIEHYT